jgi:PhnB protein
LKHDGHSLQEIAMQIQPYLFFDGRCEEALEFYRSVFGAQIDSLMRFKDSPEPHMAGPDSANKVMHASFRIGDSTVMASDGRNTGKPDFRGFSLSIEVASVEEAKKRFDALADGGQVQQALTPTFFSPGFGMVADRFGVPWMIIVARPGT